MDGAVMERMNKAGVEEAVPDSDKPQDGQGSGVFQGAITIYVISA